MCKHKLIVEMKDILLRDALTLVDRKYGDDEDEDSFFPRVSAVSCNEDSLMESLKISLRDIDCSFTPLTGPAAKEINVEVGPLHPPPPRPVRNAFAMIMAPRVATFLPVSVRAEGETGPFGTVLDQLRAAVPGFFMEIELGYFDALTEALLKTNLNKIANLLCFIHGHWKALFRSDELPNNADQQSSLLLKLTISCVRKNR